MKEVAIRNQPGLGANLGFATAVVCLLLISPNPATASDSNGTTGSRPASFDYVLAGVARIDGVSYASLIDPQTKKHFLLSSKKSAEGLTLASVGTFEDSSGPSAVVLKEGVSIVLRPGTSVSFIGHEASSPLSTVVPPTPTPSLSSLKVPPGGRMPLVFQATDPTAQGLDEEQKAAINRLRQDFIDAIKEGTPGNPNQNETATMAAPTNLRDQLANWRKAVNESDAIFKMQFGTQAFNLSQMGLSK